GYVNGRDVDVRESGDNESTQIPDSEKLSVVENNYAIELDELRESLQKALKELKIARFNSTIFEEKAQIISESAIALKDEAANAWNDVSKALDNFQLILNEEVAAKESIQKATLALSLAKERLQLAIDASGSANEKNGNSDEDGLPLYVTGGDESNEKEVLVSAQLDLIESQNHLKNCEAELRSLQTKKEELQKEVDRLNIVAENVQFTASRADEDVANIMILAEKAVANELEAAHRVTDAEIALQRAERKLANSNIDTGDSAVDGSVCDEDSRRIPVPGIDNDLENIAEVVESVDSSPDSQFDESIIVSDKSDNENVKAAMDLSKNTDTEADADKLISIQTKIQGLQKESLRDSSPSTAPKALLNKSSRFFSASFFSFTSDEEEFTPASVFRGVLESARKQWLKLAFVCLLLGTGVSFYANRERMVRQFLRHPSMITSNVDELGITAKPLIREIRQLPEKLKKLIKMLPQEEIHEEASLFDMLWLLLASVVFVPLFQKIPGGSPVLGYLAAGILIGPYGISIIHNVHATKAIAEFGVVFLLFNIGLELSVERLSSMKKYVFGLGSAQVLVTAAAVGLIAHYAAGLAGPAALVVGNGLALSSTAVVLQVLQERGESTSRHGRATFSVLLFQDLAVVVLLILLPLISPSSSKGG
ncbi:hypothetical protein M569_04551, partial [Genlisea aurea]